MASFQTVKVYFLDGKIFFAELQSLSGGEFIKKELHETEKSCNEQLGIRNFDAPCECLGEICVVYTYQQTPEFQEAWTGLACTEHKCIQFPLSPDWIQVEFRLDFLDNLKFLAKIPSEQRNDYAEKVTNGNEDVLTENNEIVFFDKLQKVPESSLAKIKEICRELLQPDLTDRDFDWAITAIPDKEWRFWIKEIRKRQR